MTTRWHERWAEKKTGWDLRGPHPLTAHLIDLCKQIDPQVVRGRWLIPGCGRAHDAPLLLELGASHVTGRDLVPLAIEEAQSCYGHLKNLTFECGSIYDVKHPDETSFECVFDRAMMCALSGDERRLYLQSIYKLLQKGGLFASIPFAKTHEPEMGPPFQITEGELRDSFKDGWQILHLEERQDGSCDQKILREWLFIAKKL